MSRRPRLLLSSALPRRHRAILLRIRKEKRLRQKQRNRGKRKQEYEMKCYVAPDLQLAGGRPQPMPGIQTHLQRGNLREGTFERLQRLQMRGGLLHDELRDIRSLLVNGTCEGGGGDARVSLRLEGERGKRGEEKTENSVNARCTYS